MELIAEQTAPQAGMDITERCQIDALASSVRQAIVDVLAAGGPLPAAEIAAALGRPVDGVYFHLTRLLSVGLIVAQRTTKEGRRPKSEYDLPGRPVKLVYSARHSAELERLIDTTLRTAGRDFRSGLENERIELAGPNRELWAFRTLGWLSREDLTAVNRRLAALIDVFAKPRSKDRHLMGLTAVVAPVSRPQER